MGKKTKKDVGALVRSSGVSFRVWAPFAESVAVSGSFNEWGQHPMESEGDGYWYALVRGAKAGQEYRFVISNGEKELRRNDPRAMNITTLAGNSVVVDPAFDWGDDYVPAIPKEEQIIYELHIGTFNRTDPATTGTFETAMTKLDYLKNLGITTIELMPIGGMMMEREWWGYTPEYMYSVENLYGGRHQLLEFVKAAHARGIAVILDVVYNHFAADNHLDLWQFDGWSENNKGGIYFYNDWRSQTPWGDTRPDYGRQEVRQFLLDNVRLWLWDCRLDGLRVDSTVFIRNTKGNNDDPDNDLADGWYLLQQINSIAKKINVHSLVVAEDIGCNHYIVKPTKDGGAGFDAQWEVNLPDTLRTTLATNDPNEIQLENLCAQLSKSYDGKAFNRVIYSDSHDSAANGSARLVEFIAPKITSGLFARQQALIAAVLVMTMPGIPMILQGQEFQQNGSFNDWQGLDWSREKRFSGILLAYEHLIAIRKNTYGNSGGLLSENTNLIHVDWVNKVIAYHRFGQGGPGDDVVVVINFGNHSIESYDIHFPSAGNWQNIFNSTWSGYSDDFKDIAIQNLEVDENCLTNMPMPASCSLIFSKNSD
jgi:1,4-alpha-glucan branching enzyme